MEEHEFTGTEGVLGRDIARLRVHLGGVADVVVNARRSHVLDVRSQAKLGAKA